MLKNDYLKITNKAELFKYSTIKESDYENNKDYIVLIENDAIILLNIFDQDSKLHKYHWATNYSSNLLYAINKCSNLFVPQVPHEWKLIFQNVGFTEYVEWIDYFKDDFSDSVNHFNSEHLSLNDAKKASDVTFSCRFQSRGFTGQTEDWISAWLLGTEQSAVSTGTKSNTILIERNVENEIIGIVCTATYAHGSEKGPIVWIREVAVIPEFQRHGIGTKLIMQALAYGISNGAKRAFLHVDKLNTSAIHLYESIGFKASIDDEESDDDIDMIFITNNS